MGVMRRVLNGFAVVDFGHASNASTSQSWVLIAISPTVDCALNQASLAA